METVEKRLVFITKGWVSSRELFMPACDISQMLLDFIQTKVKKNSYVLEDLLFFQSNGWEIQYVGPKSKRMELIGATYLGAAVPVEKTKK